MGRDGVAELSNAYKVMQNCRGGKNFAGTAKGGKYSGLRFKDRRAEIAAS